MEIVLATLLLVTDAEASPEVVEALAPSILALMVSAELIDGRQLEHFHAVYAGQFDAAARLCRECERLPRLDQSQFDLPLVVIRERIKANRLHRDWLLLRREFDCFHSELIDDAIAETDRVCRVYDLAATAADATFYVSARRAALGELRAAIGERAFAAGWLP